MAPSTDGNTLLLAPFIVIACEGVLVLFSFITAGLGENADHAADAVRLNRTRYVPKDRTVISFPVYEMIDVPLTMVLTPFVRVAMVTLSFCHSYA